MFEKGDKYIKEVIRPLLPHSRQSTFLSTGSDLRLELFAPEIFVKSTFDFPFENDLEFIHFTSISNLFNIFRSKAVWMKDLNSLEDKSEFLFANSYLDHKKSEKLKSRILSLSLCEFSEQTLTNKFMWHNYADKDKGICIKLKLHKKRGIPPFFYLGKINYKNEDLPINELIDLKKRHDQFKKDNAFTISNIDEILYSVSAMFKKECYQDEHEIRLMRYILDSSEPHRGDTKCPVEYSYDADKMKYTYFMELPLNNPNENFIAPHISIEELYIGGSLDNTEFYYLRNLIYEKYSTHFIGCKPINIYKM